MEKMLTLGVILSASDMFSSTFGKATNAVEKYDGKIQKLGKSMVKLGTLALGTGLAIGAALEKPYQQFSDLKAAQGELKSLDIGDLGIRAITKAGVDFSNTFSGTTAPQFVRAAYDIKSGISSLSDKGVAEYTRLAALTGKATKSTTEQMTSFFATGYGIYMEQFDELQRQTVAGWDKLSQEEKDIEFGKAFSTGIGASVKMFKTDGQKMQNAIEALGSAATTSNVPLSEQLVILGTMQKTFKSGEEAATAYKGFLRGAPAAQEKLNMKFVDQNNQLLSAPEILEKLRKKYGQVLDDMEKKEIKEAFGTDEGMKFITAFYGEVDTLRESITAMDAELQQGTDSVTRMAKAMNDGKEMELLSQQWSNLTTVIGAGFAPVVNKVGTIIGKITVKLAAWMEEHETATTFITTTIAVIGGLATVLGMVGIGVGTFTIALPFLTKNLKILGGAFKFVGRAILWVGRAFLLNPIGLAITAIALGAYLIYKNWDKLKSYFTKLWSKVGKSFKIGMAIILAPITAIAASAYIIYKNWDKIKVFFGDLWANVTKKFAAVGDVMASILVKPINYIKEKWQKIIDWFAVKFAWLGEMFDSIGGAIDKTAGWLGLGNDDTPEVVTVGGGFNEIKSKPTYNPPHEKSAYTPKKPSGGGGKRSGGGTNIENMNVTVNNPAKNVDVEKAITKAIKMCNSRSLSDEV